MQTVLDALMSRQSTKAATLVEPAPDDAELAEVFATAVRAPDHGAIRPWRFRVIRGDARAAFGRVMADGLKRRKPETTEEEMAAQAAKALRSPLIVAILAEVMENHPKVPPVEQVVSTGMAAQNLLLALEAKGYGAVLLSGPPAYDPHVKAAFGLAEKDAIVGFLYVGTPGEERREKKRPDPAPFVAAWAGPATVEA